MNDALLIFAKAPVPGEVKTRLLPDLSKEEAARLYEAFIYDILKSTSLIEVERFLFCHPTTDHPFFQRTYDELGIRLLAQQGQDLGERMKNAMGLLLKDGFDRVVIIGSDSPTLPVEYIVDGFKGLMTHSSVIGPSIDGGYYLVGGRNKVPPIFEGISWGTDRVFRETLERGMLLGLDLYLLPFWYDIDTFRDLSLLYSHIRYLHKNKKKVAEETIALLNKIDIFGSCLE